MIKRCLLSLLLIFSALLIFAEEKKHDLQTTKYPVIESVELTPNPVGRGDLFSMTIIVNHDNSAEVDFPLKDLPEDILLWRGPYIRSFVDSDRDGNAVRKVRITTTFKAQSSGRMIFPSMSVIAERHELKTDPILLRVGLYKNRKLYMPLEVEWQAGFDKIYAGEAVPVSLIVLNQEVVVIFDRVRVAHPRDGFFEEAGGTADIVEKTEGGIVLYDIPAATYILTSPVSGEVMIPSSGVEYEGITGWTDNQYLKITRVPEAVKESGAVGDFTFSSSISRDEVRIGENVELIVSVSGDGNLNYLKLPEPEAEGCILISSEEIEDYEPSPFGFSGSKAVKWTYSAENSGLSKINVPDFIYLEKSTDSIAIENGSLHKVNILEVAAIEEGFEAEELVLEKLVVGDDSGPAWRNYYLSALRYAWVLPGFVFFIMALIMRGKRLPLAALLSLIILVAAFSTTRFVVGVDVSDNAGERADLLYNAAVDAYGNDEITKSLHNLRAAIYYNPVKGTYRETLNLIEEEAGVVNSVSPSISLHPDVFYYILMCAVNLLFFSGVYRMVKPGGGASVLIILFTFIIVFSSAMIFYTHNSRLNMTAIVCEKGVHMKKIPSETAADWIPMEAGTALSILNKSDGFLLVETGLGVQGWVTENCLIFDR
ncbi:MAG: hypothetical protein PQJ61_06055 [Spirochaetales bacterium]|uniref:SH3b domain-containing protein n=1 Tax=Candidatus Thalassospirochaeta sargassi TaxID=3119039 RepID=A0AAJ1MIH8_9SPIO|nr:hypothetical protein [Spirochaetales bacterium]